MGVGLGSGGDEGVLFVGLDDGTPEWESEGAEGGLREGAEQAASSIAVATTSAPRLNACCRCGRG